MGGVVSVHTFSNLTCGRTRPQNYFIFCKFHGNSNALQVVKAGVQMTRSHIVQVVNSVVKPERLSRFDLILAGDDVKNKKPDPEIYNTARARLGIPAENCLVIEDSMVRCVCVILCVVRVFQ